MVGEEGEGAVVEKTTGREVAAAIVIGIAGGGDFAAAAAVVVAIDDAELSAAVVLPSAVASVPIDPIHQIHSLPLSTHQQSEWSIKTKEPSHSMVRWTRTALSRHRKIEPSSAYRVVRCVRV